MRTGKLLTEERAVSEVIGVILMVAIVVVLAAIVGTFVLGLGGSLDETPTVSIDFEFDAADTTVNVTHEGGDQLEVGEETGSVDITSTATAASNRRWAGPGSSNETLGAGDTWTSYDYAQDGATVRVVWTSTNNETSSVLGSAQAPE